VQGEDQRVASVAGLVHEALFYRDSGDLLAAAVPFVEDGLAAGQPVLVAVTSANLDLVAGAVTDPDRVQFLDLTEAGRNPGRIIPWVLHAFIQEHPDRRVRVLAEPVWPGRSTVEYPACAQHEALVNVVLAERAAAILCPYDCTRLDGHMLRDARRTHPALRHDGKRRPSPDYQPETVAASYNEPLPDVPRHAAIMEFDAAGLSRLRESVAGVARRVGLAERRVIDLQLAVSELATNAITHGAGGGSLWVWGEAGVLACEVRDDGRAVMPLAGRVPPDPGSVGGRGLVLVNYVSDLVRVHTGPDGTAIRLYMSL
jgi:anti-sigma regulatory factor (Ser/Thr protein kinase)